MKPRDQVGDVLREVLALPPSKVELARRRCADCKGTCVTGYSDGKTGSAIMCKRCRGRGFVYAAQLTLGVG